MTLMHVLQMFLDFALLTEQQGELLDTIEFNVKQAGDYVEEANVDVHQAIEYQKSIRKKQWYVQYFSFLTATPSNLQCIVLTHLACLSQLDHRDCCHCNCGHIVRNRYYQFLDTTNQNKVNSKFQFRHWFRASCCFRLILVCEYCRIIISLASIQLNYNRRKIKESSQC
jgi:hypothetical protein